MTTVISDDDIIEKLEETTRNAEQLQRETLRAILERNAGVRYLQPYLPRYHTHPVVLDPSTFRRVAPWSSNSDYADHIHKLADGVLHDCEDDKPLMSFDELLCFFYRFASACILYLFAKIQRLEFSNKYLTLFTLSLCACFFFFLSLNFHLRYEFNETKINSIF